MSEVAVVSIARTPCGRAHKGTLRDTRPDTLAGITIRESLARTKPLDPHALGDVIIGCAMPEGEQGMNVGRNIALMAGLPVTVPGMTVNRFCSSGLEAISLASLRVMAGWSEVTIGGGVESMTYVPMPGHMPRPNPEYTKIHADLYASMGITAAFDAGAIDTREPGMSLMQALADATGLDVLALPAGQG